MTRWYNPAMQVAYYAHGDDRTRLLAISDPEIQHLEEHGIDIKTHLDRWKAQHHGCVPQGEA